MLEFLDGSLTFLLAVFAVLAGWFHCVAEDAPMHGPRFHHVVWAQCRRIRPLGWALLAGVVVCTCVSIGIHRINETEQAKQQQAQAEQLADLRTATQSVENLATAHTKQIDETRMALEGQASALFSEMLEKQMALRDIEQASAARLDKATETLDKAMTGIVQHHVTSLNETLREYERANAASVMRRHAAGNADMLAQLDGYLHMATNPAASNPALKIDLGKLAADCDQLLDVAYRNMGSFQKALNEEKDYFNDDGNMPNIDHLSELRKHRKNFTSSAEHIQSVNDNMVIALLVVQMKRNLLLFQIQSEWLVDDLNSRRNRRLLHDTLESLRAGSPIPLHELLAQPPANSNTKEESPPAVPNE